MLTDKYETHEYDILVVGAGGSGLRAAIAAAEHGVSVGLICKSLLGKAHTVMAEGGVAAALGNVDPLDDWGVHFVDTMRGGQFLNDWRMVELLAKEAPERVYELERWGALFDRTPDGKILQRPFGAHTYRRLCQVGDRTGLELIRTLQYKALYSGVSVHMEVTISKLFRDGERIAGAFGYYRETGRFVVFKAKAIVLATGGFGRVYKVTSNSWECTGDGIALAYEAGAHLQDMEMVQFHPTGMVWPPGVRGILVTEAVRGDGGILLNAKGERFMERYDPVKMDLSSRDVVARAIFQEVQAGRGTPHDGVYLDITHRGPEFIKKRLPGMYHQFLQLADVDIIKQPMEVGPTIHYAMGGVRVDAESAATNVPGLYAAGELACGVHGANRLGGNALADLLVFGKRAGDAAGDLAKGVAAGNIDLRDCDAEAARLLAPFEREGKENAYALQEELQTVMQDYCGIRRNELTLRAGLEKVLELRERAQRVGVQASRLFNPGWHTAIDLGGMLTVCESIFRSAIERRESRGAQWREDYPNRDDALGNVNLIAEKDGDAMKITTAPVPAVPAVLAQLFEKEVVDVGRPA